MLSQVTSFFAGSERLMRTDGRTSIDLLEVTDFPSVEKLDQSRMKTMQALKKSITQMEVDQQSHRGSMYEPLT